MKRLVTVAVLFSLILIAIAGVFFFASQNPTDHTEQYAVELNEIANEISLGNSDVAQEKTVELRKEIRENKATSSNNIGIFLLCGICILFLAGVSIYCYVTIIRPFRRLSDFAERVAGGDLDIPLEYERSNYFGKFTWAFDNMRSELKKARACEKEAIENNKTVIAAISHDIKTPVATIRAYAEALEMGMDADPEKHSRYVETIMKKCDEVKALTEDMLTHSLTELEHLKMNPEKFELNVFLEKTLTELRAEYDDIDYEKPLYDIDVELDKSRIAQVMENLITNARKYAKSKIRVSLAREESAAVILVRDFGKGIPDEDMPFVFGKFYRGKNTSTSESGAGLGLFIVKYIVEQSGGTVSLRNCGRATEDDTSEADTAASPDATKAAHAAAADTAASLEATGLEVRIELPTAQTASAK